MTLDEIKLKQAMDLSTNSWLREICIQLAQLNEHAVRPALAAVTTQPTSHRMPTVKGR